MRPLIGIPCHAGLRAETERPIYYNNRSYIHAVECAGGIPVLIPVLNELDGLQELFPRLDGVLISGGIDVDPQYYNQDVHPLLGETNPQLDELEIGLVRWAKENHVPTLGICRGMQLINIALGGDLYQDLSADFPKSLRHANWDLPRNKLIHQVKVAAGSRMEELLGVRELSVNSLHHQAVKEAGRDVIISGYAEDGVAEFLEVTTHPFMVAVQCHPEELYTEYPVWERLFKAFIDACTGVKVVTIDQDETEKLPRVLLAG